MTTMANTKQRADWGRVGTAVVARRAQLGIKSAQEAADGTEGGCGVTSWRLVEAGHGASKRPVIIEAIERRLLWGSGSLRRIASGGEPVELDEVDDVSTRVARLEQEMADMRPLRAQVQALHDLFLGTREGAPSAQEGTEPA